MHFLDELRGSHSWLRGEADGLRKHITVATTARDSHFDTREEGARSGADLCDRSEFDAALSRLLGEHGARTGLLRLHSNFGERVVRHPPRQSSVAQYTLIDGGDECSA